MRFATIRTEGAEVPAVVHPERGVAAVPDLTDQVSGDVMSLIAEDRYAELAARADSAPDAVFRRPDEVSFTAPYRHPRKIWGIGLNYVDHASDLSERVPEEPASFMKGHHTIIGPGDPIPIPPQSTRTTAEGELGLVIGKYCRNVSAAEALDYVFGVCLLLDQTAEDILERNPRFLTRSKNFPGFFSFGPEIVPLAEVRGPNGDLAHLEVTTLINGLVHRSNTVSAMRYSPEFLVSFHSEVMPLFPGDIISTGTPGAVHVRSGDLAGCEIAGIGRLTNPVIAG